MLWYGISAGRTSSFKNFATCSRKRGKRKLVEERYSLLFPVQTSLPHWGLYHRGTEQSGTSRIKCEAHSAERQGSQMKQGKCVCVCVCVCVTVLGREV